MEKVKKRKETKIKEPTTECCLSIYHSGEKHFFVCADWLLQKWLANAIHLWAAKEASISRIWFPTIFHCSDWLKKNNHFIHIIRSHVIGYITPEDDLWQRTCTRVTLVWYVHSLIWISQVVSKKKKKRNLMISFLFQIMSVPLNSTGSMKLKMTVEWRYGNY